MNLSYYINFFSWFFTKKSYLISYGRAKEQQEIINKLNEKIELLESRLLLLTND
jgi:hypothetical protein